ncbi:MAG: AAA family ATPase [Gemmatimonadetes bacterium]|nr:AAA family ATPase [Gemmatimonadota bacterium]NIQ56094.1 AAA family ATPase [Gemmatimonadota bacterium]NIU76284.1 AAA family ATPase [Gammaproteobacteria bacterium]NIX45788.1 AAA family ATPase [Gemmatimonadota bacterium]NIY10106.1 AAA family ATPase [Gemmatimonadota bacterium]
MTAAHPDGPMLTPPDEAAPAPTDEALAAPEDGPVVSSDPGDLDVKAPPMPETLEDTGLAGEALDELLLKTLYVHGVKTGRELTESIALPFQITDERLMLLQQRRFIAVSGTTGPNRGSYRFDLTDAGRERAREAMEASQYVGPAPVPLATFEEWIRKQSLRHVRVTPETVAAGFGELVLDPDLFDMLGPAVNSARSIFLHGEPGNGKTTIAEIIAELLGGSVYLPYAVDITGQTMILYDPSHHERVDQHDTGDPDGPEWLQAVPDHDRRFVRIKRPVVMAGGELTLDQLDLQYDHKTRMYQAPFQLKAAGGVLIIDDFGRQQVSANDLLNRWIVPLEKRIDFLTLHTGVKFQVPFDSLLIFATNLQPEDLVDEAFLRRIQYKIEVGSPSRAGVTEILRRVCESREIPFLPAAVDFLYERYYDRGIPPRGCHPRDIIDHVEDIARYEGREPRPEGDVLERACETYFLIMAPEARTTAASVH